LVILAAIIQAMKFFSLAFEGPWAFAALVILAFLLAITIEAVIMLLFKLNRFKKCLLDSFMANVGSVLLSILLFLIFNKAEFKAISEFTELILLFILTVIFEAWIIRLLNPQTSWKEILPASLAMNLLTFGIMYIYLKTELGF